jgi:hypothetical protein
VQVTAGIIKYKEDLRVIKRILILQSECLIKQTYFLKVLMKEDLKANNPNQGIRHKNGLPFKKYRVLSPLMGTSRIIWR